MSRVRFTISFDFDPEEGSAFALPLPALVEAIEDEYDAISLVEEFARDGARVRVEIDGESAEWLVETP